MQGRWRGHAGAIRGGGNRQAALSLVEGRRRENCRGARSHSAYARNLMRARIDLTSAMAVVDYSNVLPGQMDVEQPGESALQLRNIAHAIAQASGVSHVLLRLYGGWITKDGVQSRGASRALMTSAAADPFPFRVSNEIVHGRFELATSLLSMPSYELPETYRVRGAVPRIRVRDGAKPSECARDTMTCPASILKRFTKDRRKQCPVEDCIVTCEMAFTHAEQKMVDTHMASDILHAVASNIYSLVAVVSGDTDLVPPLLQAARSSATRIGLMPGAVTMSQELIEVLEQAGVESIEESTV